MKKGVLLNKATRLLYSSDLGFSDPVQIKTADHIHCLGFVICQQDLLRLVSITADNHLAAFLRNALKEPLGGIMAALSQP